MIKITGLDGFSRQLEQIASAMAALDGDIAKVQFDPNDPASIQAAIAQMEAAIDGKVGAYQENTTVASIVQELKEKYREQIVERAAAARTAAKE